MTDTQDNRAPVGRPCPICGKPASPVEKPFCSRRCADVDLNRWLSGSYALPVTETDVDESDSLDEPTRD